MKQKLSVVLATYNEQDNIKSCLESVRQLADEIIVVDGSSTDETREIATSLGAKVYKTTNKPIFHLNKQMAVDKAKGSWILQLDADEHISQNLKNEIKKVISDSKSKSGYYLPRKNWFLTRFLTKGGQYPDYVIRLFKKGKGHFPCESVHEQIEIDGSVGHLKNDLLHYSDPNFKRYITRFNRYTSLDTNLLFKAKIKPGVFTGVNYLLIKPIIWFFSTYFRHKGFVDGLPGFIFSLMSSLRFPVIYFKLWEKNHAHRS
ncbi:MAG: glycosyltransferase family 2 protein [Candidatus Beckwithbacteria bacterium]